MYRKIPGCYGEFQFRLSGVLAIRTWACWGRNKWVGIGLVFWMLPCQIPAGIFMHKFLDSLQCEFLGLPRSSFRLNARQLAPDFQTLDRTAVSWCIPTNFCGEIGLCSWWERVVSYGRQPTPPLLIRVPAVLILMATFAYQNCSLFTILCAYLALTLVFTARDGGGTPLIKVICRDGSFPVHTLIHD